MSRIYQYILLFEIYYRTPYRYVYVFSCQLGVHRMKPDREHGDGVWRYLIRTRGMPETPEFGVGSDEVGNSELTHSFDHDMASRIAVNALRASGEQIYSVDDEQNGADRLFHVQYAPASPPCLGFLQRMSSPLHSFYLSIPDLVSLFSRR